MKDNNFKKQIVFCPKCWRKESGKTWILVQKDYFSELIQKLGKWETLLKVCPDCATPLQKSNL